MNSHRIKGRAALKASFAIGDEIAHQYSGYATAFGVITPDYWILSDGRYYSSISGFAETHKLICGHTITADGWKECYWRKSGGSDNDWISTISKRPVPKGCAPLPDSCKVAGPLPKRGKFDWKGFKSGHGPPSNVNYNGDRIDL